MSPSRQFAPGICSPFASCSLTSTPTSNSQLHVFPRHLTTFLVLLPLFPSLEYRAWLAPKMNSNDLFSFLDEALPEVDDHEPEVDNVHAMNTDDRSEVPKKRKANEDDISAPPMDDTSAHPEGESEAGPSEPKRLRMSSPNPMVTDEVEIEAKREVAASAGLQGSVEAGSRLELRHQVCATHFVPSGSATHALHPRFGIKSRCRLVTLTYLSRIMYLLRNQHENTSSRWTPSSKCRCMQSSVTRVYWCLHTRVRVRLL